MPITDIPDLWPNDLIGPATVTPMAILRRQGEALGAKTHNIVSGEVETRTGPKGTKFEHDFVLVAPFLRFRFPLLRVSHGVQAFPATVVETDLTGQSRQRKGLKLWNKEVTTEDELIKALEEFFGTDSVKEVVRSLVAQSTDFAPDNENT
jgi:hypothetical protein